MKIQSITVRERKELLRSLEQLIVAIKSAIRKISNNMKLRPSERAMQLADLYERDKCLGAIIAAVVRSEATEES